MKNTTLIIGMVAIILIIGAFVFMNSGITNANGNSVKTSDLNTSQEVVISMKNGNYYPQTIRVKSGMPVEISLDSSVRGCYRSFTISAFGVRKYLATPSDTLTFTPNQKGTFRFACSMGMGTGTLIVE